MSQQWRLRASCRSVDDPEIFFPVNAAHSPAGVRSSRIEQAREYCRTCPVTDECHAFAVRSEDEFAIMAGLLPKERRDEVRAHARAREARGTRHLTAS